ncbi:hypothetical protein PIIN_05710 [Serendipita indica DSM 11827]|uniref:Uncharacterized protein n=1 Tax=Serendipita indica (strain DSM 11827) TaxID=1109443 RepID=G4TKD2_SERID|nr:hypothetical protein PIIN_05710 [Serendipita indica DSM 11827]
MGKKRKPDEISDDERIQTVLVRQPYGWNDPSVWDAEDRKRNDNGLYVLVEWLTFIFGGAGEPGTLQNLRRLGYVVEDVWWWSSRNEILVPRVDPGAKHTILSKARYEGAVQIVGKGEGWKSVPNIPVIQPTSIRTDKFVIPYPAPGPFGSSTTSSGPSDQKPTIKPEPGVRIKPEQSLDAESRAQTEEFEFTHVPEVDEKPDIRAESEIREAYTLTDTKVKADPRNYEHTPSESRVEAELETQTPFIEVKEEVDSKDALADELAAQRAHQRLLDLAAREDNDRIADRPTKRVKVEQP